MPSSGEINSMFRPRVRGVNANYNGSSESRAALSGKWWGFGPEVDRSGVGALFADLTQPLSSHTRIANSL